MNILDGNGNLKSTYTDCLKEHEVDIDNQKYFLIKTFYGTNTREDFLRTYSHYLDAELIDKIDVIPDKIEFNEYGVLYSRELEVIAVFNMKFAHYSFELKKIIFKEPEEVLIAHHKGEFASNKSVDEQIKEKLDSCIDKVNIARSKSPIKELPSLRPPPGPNPRITKLNEEEIKEIQERFNKINKNDRDDKKRRFMNHAIMYAAITPISYEE